MAKARLGVAGAIAAVVLSVLGGCDAGEKQLSIQGGAKVSATSPQSQTKNMDYKVGNTSCIAPASPGGGYDFTCRSVGQILNELDLVPGQVQVTNMTGGGGGVAYAHVVVERATDENLIVAASSATATRLAQNLYAGMTADQVRFVASLGADYGMIAVKADSPYKTLRDLFDALKSKPESISFAGGSAVAGYDHLKVLQLAKASGIKELKRIKYIGLDSGGDAVTQVLGGHVQAVTGDVSEVVEFAKSGDIRLLGVLSEERIPGIFAGVPTAKEQGINVVSPNWRGFFVPQNSSKESYLYWADALRKVSESELWKNVMRENGLMPFFKTGPVFHSYVNKQIADLREISRDVGIIK